MDQELTCNLWIDCKSIDYRCLCSKNSLFTLLGLKWMPEIVTILAIHPKMRYKEISQHLKTISPTVLSKRLKELERKKYISRTKLNQSPPRVDYSLTLEGMKVWEKLQVLIND